MARPLPPDVDDDTFADWISDVVEGIEESKDPASEIIGMVLMIVDHRRQAPAADPEIERVARAFVHTYDEWAAPSGKTASERGRLRNHIKPLRQVLGIPEPRNTATDQRGRARYDGVPRLEGQR